MKKFIVAKTRYGNFIILEVSVRPDVFFDGRINRYIILSTWRDLPYAVQPYEAFDTVIDAETYAQSLIPDMKDAAIKKIQSKIDKNLAKIEAIKNKTPVIRKIYATK